MSDHEFPISVADLDAGGREHRFPIRAAWVRGAFEGLEPTAGSRDGELVVRVSKSGSDVVVHGSLDSELSVPCARCLEPVALPIHLNLSVLYVPRAKLKSPKGSGTEEGHALTDEEADTLPYEGETVVLDDLVRDELMLEVPMIPLCSEACPGMSTAPIADKALSAPAEEKGIDPRLAPLLRFREHGMKKE